MAGRKIWVLLILLGIVLGVFLLSLPAVRIIKLRGDVPHCEAVCLSLSNSLQAAQANGDWNRLQWYYAFREVEVEDAEAWRLASRKVDAELASLSNSLRLATDRLARRKAELAVMEHTNENQAEPSAPANGASPRR
ncbi:MAG: hypothetical protein ABSA97_06790 [Verrucomicrobiia bacterium]